MGEYEVQDGGFERALDQWINDDEYGDEGWVSHDPETGRWSFVRREVKGPNDFNPKIDLHLDLELEEKEKRLRQEKKETEKLVEHLKQEEDVENREEVTIEEIIRELESLGAKPESNLEKVEEDLKKKEKEKLEKKDIDELVDGLTDVTEKDKNEIDKIEEGKDKLEVLQEKRKSANLDTIVDELITIGKEMSNKKMAEEKIPMERFDEGDYEMGEGSKESETSFSWDDMGLDEIISNIDDKN